MSQFRIVLVTLIAFVLMSGCSQQSPMPDDPAAARGEALFKGMGACNTCHDVTDGTVIVGPSLRGIASRAAQREPGVSAQAYIEESIVAPNKFIVPGFQAGLMPQTYAERLTKDQIVDLVAYLMTLK